MKQNGIQVIITAGESGLMADMKNLLSLEDAGRKIRYGCGIN